VLDIPHRSVSLFNESSFNASQFKGKQIVKVPIVYPDAASALAAADMEKEAKNTGKHKAKKWQNSSNAHFSQKHATTAAAPVAAAPLAPAPNVHALPNTMATDDKDIEAARGNGGGGDDGGGGGGGKKITVEAPRIKRRRSRSL